MRDQIERAVEEGRLEDALRLREQWLNQAPESVEAAQAGYQAALSRLFQDQVDRALELLREVVRTRCAPWAGMARVSLATLLLKMNKVQQATFELRKASNETSLTGVQAQALLAEALTASGKGQDAEKVRDAMKKRLAQLGLDGGVDGALASLMLGMEHKRDGERSEARRHLQRALDAPELPEEHRALARQALSET